MHDLIIRGGTVVDGTGRPPFTGDVAIDGDRITEIGQVSGAAREVLDADGLLVAPGWVDIHTHYDGQACWDPLLTPSFWHGVTSVVMGNCGVGFAPVREERREWLIELMENVEDIPARSLKAGMDWQWESFGGYLEALAAMPRAVDVGAMLGHCALRTYVMDERGARNEAASAEELEAMARIVGEAMAAGALGFSTSRTLIHVTPEGVPIPGTFAAYEELAALGHAVKRSGVGVLEVIPAGIEGIGEEVNRNDLALCKRLAADTGCPLTYLVTQTARFPDLWRESFRIAEEARIQGVALRPQISPRPVGMLFSFESENPFARFPSFQALQDLPRPERAARLRDPAVKKRILEDHNPNPTDWSRTFERPWRLTYPLGTTPNYAPDPSTNVRASAERLGKSPAEVGYDLMLENDAQAFLMFTAAGYAEGNLDAVREMLTHPLSLLGGSDGGAHCRLICDASVPTFMLTHWARDEVENRLPLEWVVRKQTSDTARFFGLVDRGELSPGKKADLNLIDLAHLAIHTPELTCDLPAQGQRLIQRAEGYVATIVSGQVIQRNGEDTGARPGAVIRARGGGSS